ncbi:hypothetical protein L596_026978 [Steinernema carpocapsae]|uniref:Rapamycin-insensitive companion of mTOR N-terminal domain-containing protein n=1 Tax=Steinernema carpocapsae TaxID=34508 RepID=A0A4U5M3W0_STECR|nr:hypothetical protein L596_026978 [Steinernema carpocapsae]
MYAQPGPSRLKSRRRGRRPPPVTEPHISYSELIDYLSSTDFSELEANVESFFVNLNRVALQLKDRNEAQVGNEEFFNLAFHKFLYLLNNKQSCVRTVVLRIFRLLLVKERVLQQYLHYRLDIVVLRALDMHLNGEAERIQALKMMVRMFEIYRKTNEPDRLHFRKSFLQSAVAVVRAALPKKSGEQKTTDEELKKGNRLWLGAFAFLLETSILEPKLVISSIGTEWLVRILMEPAITQRIVGQVCRILIAWLDCPVLRAEGRLNFVLEKLFSPLIEIGFFYQPAPDEDGKSSMSPRVVDTLEICSFVANPHLAKIRDMAIDICCQFVDLPYAEKKFATWNEALEYYATMHYPDRFKCGITQEFVLAEHTPVFNDHVDLLGSFRAAAVYVLVNAGLSQSLVRLILSVPDEPSGVKATLLLSDLLRTGASVLPRDWRIRLMSLASAATEDEEKAMILVYRLSQLNELILTRPTRTTIISNTELFVQNVNEPEKLPHEKTHSKKKSGHVLDERAVYSVLEEHLPDAVSHGVINWTKVDHVLQAFESDEGWRALKNCKHNDRCHTFFGEIVAFFLPHKGHLLMKGMEHEKFVVECGCRLFRLLAPLCDELHYRELLEHFVKDFADQIRKENLGSGVLALKNIMNTGAMHYFALIGAISSTKRGCEIMDHMMVFQIFLDFMNSTTPSEYVKLIVSCLDYSTPDSLARLILSTALTATSDTSRKWVIRFIGVSPAFKNRIYSDFISRNLIQRLGDSSPKVVRHVVKILHSWLPQNPGAYGMLNLLGPSLKTHGDAGVLLKTHIYSSEEMTFKNMNAAEEFLRFWDTRFNDRYVEVVEDEVRSTLTSVRRTMHGTFGRPSNERDGNWSIPVPIHLFGVLARHKTGLSLLKKARIVEELLTRLREVTWMTYETDGLPIKAALLGLAHIIGNVSKDPRISEIVPPETVPIIARFAEECQLLSVRGTALWAMNIIGAGEFGALQLAKIGWESNRHQDALEEVQQGLYEFVPSPRIHLPCFESGPNRPHGLETVREESESDEPTSVDLEESLLNAATMMRLVNVDQDPEAHFSSAYRSQIGMKKLSTTRKLSYLPTDRQVVATDVYREIVEGTKSLVSRQATAMHSMWSYVSFPCEVYLMTEDVFRKAPLPKKLSTSSMGRNENRNFHFDHNYKICFHCKGSRNARDPLDENVRNDTLQNINLMEILSKSQEKKLFQTYRSNRNVFKNRCLYADVLELLSERKYRLGTRSLLHQLFWKAFQVEL